MTLIYQAGSGLSTIKAYLVKRETPVVAGQSPALIFNGGQDSRECRIVHFLSIKSEHSAEKNREK